MCVGIKICYSTLWRKVLGHKRLPGYHFILYIVDSFVHTSERQPVDGTRSRMACHLPAPAYINFIMFSLFFLPLYKGQFVNDIAARHRIKTFINVAYENLSFLIKRAKAFIVKWERGLVSLTVCIF